MVPLNESGRRFTKGQNKQTGFFICALNSWQRHRYHAAEPVPLVR